MKHLLAVLLMLCLASTSAFAAVSFEFLNTDAAFAALERDTAYGAEGRIGGQGTFELDIQNENATPVKQDQFDWPNGDPVPFTLTYDAGVNTVTYSVGSGPTTLTFSPALAYDNIFIRTRAVNGSTSIIINDLEVFGSPSGGSSVSAPPVAAVGPDGVQYLWIKGLAASQGFRLTGESTMFWIGDKPRQSRLAYQIKSVDVVPEPASMALLGTGFIGLVGARLRRRKKR